VAGMSAPRSGVVTELSPIGQFATWQAERAVGDHDRNTVHLRVEVDCERLQFSYRVDDDGWRWLPQLFDASILSDEATAPGLPNFTGAFVGMCCQDLAGTALPADFDYFEYVERPYRARPWATEERGSTP